MGSLLPFTLHRKLSNEEIHPGTFSHSHHTWVESKRRRRSSEVRFQKVCFSRPLLLPGRRHFFHVIYFVCKCYVGLNLTHSQQAIVVGWVSWEFRTKGRIEIGSPSESFPVFHLNMNFHCNSVHFEAAAADNDVFTVALAIKINKPLFERILMNRQPNFAILWTLTSKQIFLRRLLDSIVGC